MVATDQRPTVVSLVQVEIPAFGINFQVRLQLRPQRVDDLFANVADLLEGFAADFGDDVAKVDSTGTEAKLSQARSQALHGLEDWSERLKQVNSWKSKADRLAVQLSETRAAHLKEATFLRQQLRLKAQAESRGYDFVPTDEVHFGTHVREDEADLAAELQKDFAAKLRQVEAQYNDRISTLNEQLKTARMMVTYKDKLLDKRREDLALPEDRVSVEEEDVLGDGGGGPRDHLLRCLQQNFGSLEAALGSLSSSYDLQGGLGPGDFSRLLAEVGFPGDPGQAFAALRADVVHLANVLSDERSCAGTDAGHTTFASYDSDGETWDTHDHEDSGPEVRPPPRSERRESRPARPPRHAVAPCKPSPASSRRKLSTQSTTSSVGGTKRHSVVATTEDKAVGTGPYESCFPPTPCESQACQTLLTGEVLDKASQYFEKEAETHWQTLLEKSDGSSDSEASEDSAALSEDSRQSPPERRSFRALAVRRLSEESESSKVAASSSAGRGACKDATCSPSKEAHARELRHLVEAAEEVEARLPELRTQAERLLREAVAAGHGEFKGVQERALVARLERLMRSAGGDGSVPSPLAPQASLHLAPPLEPAAPQSPKAPTRAQGASANLLALPPGAAVAVGGPKPCPSVAEILSRHGVQEAACRLEAPPRSPCRSPCPAAAGEKGALEGATASRIRPPHTRGPRPGEIGQAATLGHLPVLCIGGPAAASGGAPPARRASAESIPAMGPSESCPAGAGGGGNAGERRQSGGPPSKPCVDKSQLLTVMQQRRASSRAAEGRPTSSYAPMTISSLVLEPEELPPAPLDTSDEEIRSPKLGCEFGRQARNSRARPASSVDPDAWGQAQDPLQRLPPTSPRPPVTPVPPQHKRPVAAMKVESQDLPPMTKVTRGSVGKSETADALPVMRPDPTPSLEVTERLGLHAPAASARRLRSRRP